MPVCSRQGRGLEPERGWGVGQRGMLRLHPEVKSLPESILQLSGAVQLPLAEAGDL